jgi:hypothetical protein
MVGINDDVVDCQTGCSLVTGGNMITVSKARLLYILDLPQYFQLTFEVYGPTLTSNGADPLLQILNLVNLDTGADFVGVAVSDSRALYFYYNEAMVTEETDSALLVPDFVEGWITVKITTNNVEATISTSSDYTQVYHFPVQAYGSLPTSIHAYLFASKESSMSAGGYVRNIQITGRLCFFYLL